MRLQTHDRYDYHPIEGRPDYSWPLRNRLAVYIALDLGHLPFGEEPDIYNISWRDYGSRVGAWRLLRLFASLDLPASVLVNATLYGHCPDLIAAFRKGGDEIIACGPTSAERRDASGEPAEPKLIAETSDVIERHEGTRPEGWFAPWISGRRIAPDLLKEAGYAYVLDWCCDDQPIWLRTRAGPLLAIPYPQEINDMSAIVARGLEADAFADMIVDQFDEMLEQSAEQPLVCGIALHAGIIGQPFRLRHLRRALRHVAQSPGKAWITTCGAIAQHAATLPPGTVPGST